VLELPQTQVSILTSFENKFKLRHTLWKNRYDFENLRNKWYRENFKDQDAAEIEATVKKYYTQTLKIKNTEFSKGPPDDVLNALMSEVSAVREHMRLIMALGNKTMTEKFWSQIYDTIGMHKIGGLQMQVTLQHIIANDALNHIDAIESISNMARGEDAINKTMNDVISHWDNLDFFVFNYRDSKDRFIIK
jgi:hypothetical protein